uniref:Uncharacterized protein n=1 Tax=Bracon brevicornis TaxID=1563983 RepID=A0A6V7LP56_9HYME
MSRIDLEFPEDFLDDGFDEMSVDEEEDDVNDDTILDMSSAALDDEDSWDEDESDSETESESDSESEFGI